MRNQDPACGVAPQVFDTPAVEFATLERVDWFNNCRLLGPIGNVPPAEAEVNHCAMLDEMPAAAQH